MQEEETTPTGNKQERQEDACAADMPMDMTDLPSPRTHQRLTWKTTKNKTVVIKQQMHGGILERRDRDTPLVATVSITVLLRTK